MSFQKSKHLTPHQPFFCGRDVLSRQSLVTPTDGCQAGPHGLAAAHALTPRLHKSGQPVATTLPEERAKTSRGNWIGQKSPTVSTLTKLVWSETAKAEKKCPCFCKQRYTPSNKAV